MGKNNNTRNGILIVLAILVVGGLAWGFGTGQLSIGGDGDDKVDLIVDKDVLVLKAECQSTTGLSAFKANVFNGLNTTGSENYDVTLHLTDVDGDIIETVTDTTSPTAVDVGCGEYYAKIERTNADGGDSSEIITATVNAPNTWDPKTGKLKIIGATANFRITSKQHGLMEFKARDNIGDGFMFDVASEPASATTFKLDGVVFTSVIDNATATDESLGLDISYEVRSTGSDTDANDLGTYVLLEAPTASWDIPTVKLGVAKLSEVKGDLETAESRLFSDYEYAYLMNVPILDGSDSINVNVKMNLVSGISTVSADIEIDFAVIGNYLGVQGQAVKTGAATDAATAAAVYTVQDTAIDLT